MFAELAMRWTDGRSTSMYTTAPDHTLPRRSGTAMGQPLVPRGPRLPRSITCSLSANAGVFSGDRIDSTVIFIPKATQDTPALGSVVERSERTLEEGEKNIKHDPARSLTLGVERLAIQSQTIQGNGHGSRFIEEGPGPSALAVREPASCPPELAMLSHGQEPGYYTPETRRFVNDAEFQDVLSSAPEEGNGVVWDVARDNEILGYFHRNRRNLVLDSVVPEYAPHIVITQVEEAWEDQYTSWQNRVDIQWPCYLMVPQVDMSIGGLPVPEPTTHPLPGLAVCPPPLNSSPLIVSREPMPVFSHSRFRPCTEFGVVGCIVRQVVRILQRAHCKAAFFDASSFAGLFRKRYDSQPSILSNIDPTFTWSDPAEPILSASRRHFGTTILDSICPFVVPHIVINEPPPQPPQLTENNATPYIQDAGFGQQLIVPSNSVEIINAAEDWVSCSPTFSDVDAVDHLESGSPSRPGTPVPETPVDEDGDHHFFAWHGDEGYDDDIRASSVHSSVYSFDLYAHAETQHAVGKLQAKSRPIFFIDEDEDDLPSLDDW